MKKKILYTASTDIHLMNFHVPYIKLLSERGYEVHVACNGNRKIPYATKQYRIAFQRSPLAKKNIEAYKTLKELIVENGYALIHCHTPTCGVITRLAARKARKKDTKVVYTAHGFHFYKGASKKNWVIFYPVEVLLSYITDGIITMNEEDFKRLSTSAFKTKNKYLINGIGVNPERLKFDTHELVDLKEELQLRPQDVVVLYIAEFIPRKNHQFIFNQLRAIIDQHKNVKFLFAGGFASEKIKLEEQAVRENILDHIKFLGYRDDIGKIITLADIGISSSIAEGLPIGVLELMYNNIPVVASNIRGHEDIICDGNNGYLFNFDTGEKFKNVVVKLIANNEFRKELGKKAKSSITKFLLPPAVDRMSNIYDDFLN
ncbi:glycosyltransferase EpsD [Mesonia algae]|uniref:Glycosyltransferase EpsD n=1 Tax=Mesonia algae TaxID=213248 RepID=A0A2W7ICE9_9FLAO|nr:glycosyltransferase [Mesonia algae]PZW43768.1 glycosyltransferase EpsD [Mesonia algae]